MSDVRMVASFPDEEQCVHMIERLREARLRPKAFSPIPSEKIREALYEQPSRVRAWVLGGGIFGALSGFAITIGTSYEWNLNAGGKPIDSLPPYLIIVFELMILCGGLAGLLSFFFYSRLPVLDPTPGYSEHFSSNRFGVVVDCADTESSRIEALLREGGAEEITSEPL